MEKVILYDKDNDKVYDIMLSPENARRVASDITFATSLLNATIKNMNDKENEVMSEVLNEHNLHSDTMSETSDIHDVQSTDCEESSQYRWSETSVLLLLRTYEETEEKLNSGKLSQKKCWELISEIFKKNGHNITGPQCASKFRSLKKTYKSIKDHNSKSGNNRRTWQYFEVMDNMFSEKAWCKPIALASSTGLSIKNISIEECFPTCSNFSSNTSCSDKENDLSEKSMKLTKMSATKLFQERLQQKEEHERKKQKRHEERMVIESKLLEALTNFLNK